MSSITLLVIYSISLHMVIPVPYVVAMSVTFAILIVVSVLLCFIIIRRIDPRRERYRSDYEEFLYRESHKVRWKKPYSFSSEGSSNHKPEDIVSRPPAVHVQEQRADLDQSTSVDYSVLSLNSVPGPYRVTASPLQCEEGGGVGSTKAAMRESGGIFAPAPAEAASVPVSRNEQEEPALVSDMAARRPVSGRPHERSHAGDVELSNHQRQLAAEHLQQGQPVGSLTEGLRNTQRWDKPRIAPRGYMLPAFLRD